MRKKGGFHKRRRIGYLDKFAARDRRLINFGLKALRERQKQRSHQEDRRFLRNKRLLIRRMRRVPSLRAEEKRTLMEMFDSVGDWVSPDVFMAIAYLAALGGGEVVLDGDGVMWSGDVGLGFADGFLETGRDPDATGHPPGFFRWLYQQGHYPDRAAARAAWKKSWGTDAFYDEMTKQLAGVSAPKANGWGREYFGRYHRDEIYLPMTILVEGLRALGFKISVASGGPFAPVAAGAAYFGVKPNRVIGLDLERDATNVLTDRIQGGVAPWGEGKAQHVEQRILGWQRDQLAMAFGDTKGDWPMLDRAQFPIVFNPCPASSAEARKRGWAIQLTPAPKSKGLAATAPWQQPMPRLGSLGLWVRPESDLFPNSSQNLTTMPNHRLNSMPPNTRKLFDGFDKL
jgi:phosphoserine phosphatase